MQTVQSSVLVLYSSLLPDGGGSNTYGTANTNFTDLTFSNINMRQILGSNYGKYHKFNLSLTSLNIPTISTTISNGNDALIMFYMSGLNFSSGSAYSSVTGLDVSSAFIGDARLNRAGSSAVNVADLITYPTTFFNTFSISKDITDITINLRSAVATLTATGATFILNPPSSAVYPEITYTFFITPVLETALLPFPSQEEQTLVYKQRLIKS